jgi:hypothetical protein
MVPREAMQGDIEVMGSELFERPVATVDFVYPHRDCIYKFKSALRKDRRKGVGSSTHIKIYTKKSWCWST